LRRDLPAIIKCDALAAASQGREGVSEAELLAALRQRNCISMVATVGDSLAGYMVYTLHKTWLGLSHIAFSPDCPEAGSALVEKLWYKLASHRRQELACCGYRLDKPGILSPSLLTADVRAMCNNSVHPYLPVLADALQDAGCDDDKLLADLRTPGLNEAVYAGIAVQLRGW
jgi:hypothetical protein